MNGSQPVQLSQGSSPGSYAVSNSNGDIVVDYELPQAASSGQSFAVQINYTVSPVTANLIDWNVVPGTHPGQVDSSKVTINFPDGQAPSADFVRVTQGSGSTTVSGSSIVIQSTGVIPANQPFEIQLPYGSAVGQPANGNSAPVQNAPVQNAPIQNAPSTGATGTSNDSSGGILGNILPILCIVGLPRDESAAILSYLWDLAEDPLFQCRFRWQPNSIAFWDNRSVQHRAMWDYWPHTRSGHRVTVAGDRPV